MTSELTATWTMIRYMFERSRMTLTWWIIGVALYTVINVAVYPAFKDSILLETQSYPQGLIDAFGLSNLDQLGPYLYAQVFLMLPLVLAFLPIMSFAGAIAGAEERGGLDVTLTQPVSRRSYVFATWIVAVVSVGIVLLITGVLAWLTIQLIGENLGLGDTMLAAWSVFPVTVAVGTIGLVLSALMRSRGAVLGASIGIVFLLYLIDVIGNINKDLDGLRYISPFRYFNDVFTYTVPVWHYLLLIVLALVLLVASVKLFERRDIYT